MADLVLERVTKEYANGVVAVSDLSLEVPDGELLVLVGPSGCGKSTALRLVAGLEDISAGEIRIGGRLVNDVPPKDRDIAMVFQSYALYPHMTVFDNIAFALKLAKIPRDEIRRRVEDAADVLELRDHLGRRPAQLSGGQRQRVAMGRAIVRQPAAFLMDEPLSNLDAKLRVQMRAEIARIQRDLGVTTVYVTHDQVEAMTMGDRVAVLRDGLLQQVDPPQVLYERPRNVFVAAFIGSPAMSLLESRVVERGEGLAVELGGTVVPLPPELLAQRPAVAGWAGRPVVVGVRPEDLEDPALADPGLPRVPATVELVESLGSELVVHLSLDARAVDAGDPDSLTPAALGADAGAVVVGRFQPRSQVRRHDAIEVAVAADRLHLFDPADGSAIWA